VANHAETVWGPDVEEFRPERWDKLEGLATHPYANQTFNPGPRNCIGKSFALMEFKVLLVELLSKFRFGLSPELEKLGGRLPELQNPAVTLRIRGGLKVSVERI
jgi:cytochrome P450